ncbi:NAD-dependent epimerase/dehydratase family protein [Bacteroides intestinalis]|jgi:putative NDP-sugar dehydratase or epimerase|uniref:NAD-dependent epimerase/dehydratase family protein n=1 Tax=Bacteroides intestinalis TaxID=329854 RepID=UPI00189C8E73|nr:NAD(P)-dependent oxidoreductase [Bacteroides intestinalis]
MTKKILVFGANGAIGRYLVDYFYERKAEHNIELVTADLNGSGFLDERSKFYQVDISKKEQVDGLPTDIYAVIDLATTMPARMKGFNPKHYLDVNIGGTFNILEFCKKNNVDRILFAQTFGDILYRSEEIPELKVGMTSILDYKDSKSVYITTMNTCVELIKCYHGLFNQRSFIFRLPTIYSWNSKPYFEEGVETKKAWRILIDQAISGEDIHVWGDPNRKKDMVYVKDLCQEFYKASFVDKDFGFYNIGTGVGTSLLDQIKGFIEVFGGDKKSNILFSPEKPNAPQYIMNIDEAKQDLGYEPKYLFMDMLRDMKKEMQLNRF